MNQTNRLKKIKQAGKWVAGVILFQFILINISAAFHAYRFTHYYDSDHIRNLPPSSGTIFLRTWRMMVGKRLPKSVINNYPVIPYDTVRLATEKGIPIEGWLMRADSSKGTVILFHGLSSNKGNLITIAYEFLEMGYNTFLIDLRAHGNSGGETGSLGAKESEEVKLVYEFIKSKGEENIILWGISLGAVIIPKAIHDYKIKPTKIIIEMPFDGLQNHVSGRARVLNFPDEPFGFFVTFWIGIEQGYWGYGHKTSSYMRGVQCPVLLQWGRQDQLVKEKETKNIFTSIKSTEKQLIVYESGGHYPLISANENLWRKSVSDFLKQ